MIKVFNATDKNYSSNGDIVLRPTKARVNNADNGDFTLELTCDTEYNDYIKPNNIIVTPTPQGDQAFRIRTVTKKSNRIDVKAYHVYYDSENYIIADSYAINKTCAEALAYFNAHTDITSPFSTGSNITDAYNMRCVRKSLKECITDILERWGGHLKRDNFNITILESIGIDNGITIEYRKNLKELTAEYDFTNVCTKVLPVGKDGALLPNLYVLSDTQYAVPYTKVVSFTQNIDAKDYPTQEAYEEAIQEDLLSQATDYLNTYSVPIINYTLKGIPEKVTDIGDYIRVKDKRIGIDVITQVISYEYDAIQERYVSLEFGNFTTDLSDLLNIINSETNVTVESAVNQATEGKQDTLIEGDNITIQNNVISATNTVYSQGNGISINNNSISLENLSALSFKYTVASYKRDNALNFTLILPKPDHNNSLNIEDLSIDIYNGSYTTVLIVDDGVTQGDFIVNKATNETLVNISITDTSGAIYSLTDGAYTLVVDITLN